MLFLMLKFCRLMRRTSVVSRKNLQQPGWKCGRTCTTEGTLGTHHTPLYQNS